jgi:hypothetical protein
MNGADGPLGLLSAQQLQRRSESQSEVHELGRELGRSDLENYSLLCGYLGKLLGGLPLRQ